MRTDFLRIDATHKITMKVPLHCLNQRILCGCKAEGGAISIANDVEKSLVYQRHLEFLTVDFAAVHIGTTLHLSTLLYHQRIVDSFISTRS